MKNRRNLFRDYGGLTFRFAVKKNQQAGNFIKFSVREGAGATAYGGRPSPLNFRLRQLP